MSSLFGIIAVFNTPQALRGAAMELQQSGFGAFEAYTPYPVEGLEQVIHPGPKWRLPVLMFVAAMVGAAWGYWIQYWDEAVNYPINVGGRPYNSWPAFIVGTFEFMLLFTVAAGFFGMLAASRLPKLYHPIFESAAFARASRDRFLICVEARDRRFNADSIREVLRQAGAERIEELHA